MCVCVCVCVRERERERERERSGQLIDFCSLSLYCYVIPAANIVCTLNSTHISTLSLFAHIQMLSPIAHTHAHTHTAPSHQHSPPLHLSHPSCKTHPCPRTHIDNTSSWAGKRVGTIIPFLVRILSRTVGLKVDHMDQRRARLLLLPWQRLPTVMVMRLVTSVMMKELRVWLSVWTRRCECVCVWVVREH